MLQRITFPDRVTVGTSVEASTAFNFGNAAGGTVFVPAGSSITALAWHGSHNGVTYLPLYDGAGNAVSTTVSAGQCAAIPMHCFGCAFLKAVDAAGGTIDLSLKS